MFIKYKDRELECVTTLRTAMNIQTRFRKPYLQVLQSVESMDLAEQLQILYSGIELGKDNDITFTDFKEYFLENEGMDSLLEYMEKLFNGLQYPGLDEEEIEKKLMEKAQKQNRMKEIGLIR